MSAIPLLASYQIHLIGRDALLNQILKIAHHGRQPWSIWKARAGWGKPPFCANCNFRHTAFVCLTFWICITLNTKLLMALPPGWPNYFPARESQQVSFAHLSMRCSRRVIHMIVALKKSIGKKHNRLWRIP